MTRTDAIQGKSVQQVTYAGLPLYFFFQDEEPGETDGANLFDNVVNPTGIWYLVDAIRGQIHRVRHSCSSRRSTAGHRSRRPCWRQR